MKKRLSAVLCAAIMMCTFVSQPARAQEAPFEIDAAAAILIEAKTGQVILEKNADEQLDLAGTIKIMGALVIAREMEGGLYDLSTPVQIGDEAVRIGGMSAFLSRGATYSLEELIKPMMMICANDAMAALAQQSAGSEQAFVEKMNQAARELKISPVFVNATGHKAEGQKMSVREAAVISRELVQYPQLLQYSGIYMDELSHADGRITELVNPNRLVRFYTGCDGLMTGSTSQAGYSGAFTAQRDGQRYIAVIAGAKNNAQRSELAQQMLEYAFANYTTVVVMEEGTGVARDVPVEGGTERSVHGAAGEDCALLIRKGEEGQISKEPVLYEETLTAPVCEGDKIGEIVVKKNSEIAAKVPIVAAKTIEKASIKRSLRLFALDFLRK